MLFRSDYVINLMLVDMDQHETMIAFPRDRNTGKPMGVLDERFRGMDAKQVFDILREEQEENEGGSGGQSEGGSESPDGGLDSHDWDDAQSMSEEDRKQLQDDIDQALRQGNIYAGKVGAKLNREISELLAPKVDWQIGRAHV